MAIDPILKDALERQSFASMMGIVGVVTFSEGEAREIFAVVGGLPVPYGRFMAVFTSILFRHDADTGREWQVPIGNLPKIDPLSSLWAKIALPVNVDRDNVDPFHATPLVRERIKSYLNEQCTHPVIELRRDQLAALIERIESLMMESVANPIAVSGLANLFDYPLGDPTMEKLVARFAMKAAQIKANSDLKLAELLNAQNIDTY